MYYLLHDPNDAEQPFEIFLEDLPNNSMAYTWFHLTTLSYDDFSPFDHGELDDMSVADRCDNVVGGATYVLHTFTSKPTVAEIIQVINQHPELLI